MSHIPHFFVHIFRSNELGELNNTIRGIRNCVEAFEALLSGVDINLKKIKINLTA